MEKLNNLLQQFPKEVIDDSQLLSCLICQKNKDCKNCISSNEILKLLPKYVTKIDVINKFLDLFLDENITPKEEIEKDISFYYYLTYGINDFIRSCLKVCHFCNMTNHFNGTLSEDTCILKLSVNEFSNGYGYKFINYCREKFFKSKEFLNLVDESFDLWNENQKH